jgi:PAS domain S-box-containing protein
VLSSTSLSEAEDLLRAILDSSDVLSGVFELEADDYRYAAVNRATAAFYRRAPEQMVGRSGRDLGLTPEQIAGRMEVLWECWRTRSPRRREYRFEHDGVAGWFLGSFAPLKGERPRVGFVLIDVTRQKLAEEAAADHRRKLEVALDATELGLWEYDIAHDRILWDPRMRALFGLAADTPIDLALYDALLHPEDRAAVRAAYTAALQGEGQGRYQVTHRNADGSRWLRGSCQVIFGEEGRPERILGTCRDITAEVAAREQEGLLIAELNHRVKNNLATVQSIAVQTARSAPSLRGFLDTFEGRIVALARTHDVLTARAWCDADLAEVIARETVAYGDRVRLQGPPVPLSSHQALALGLIVHELSTNAAKYGALSVPAGSIDIRWTADDAGAEVAWDEAGGPPCAAPQTLGFGTRLMTKLARGDLGGDIAFDYPSRGLAVRLRCGPRASTVSP